MDAKSLMIGDWVCLNSEEGESWSDEYIDYKIYGLEPPVGN